MVTLIISDLVKLTVVSCAHVVTEQNDFDWLRLVVKFCTPRLFLIIIFLLFTFFLFPVLFFIFFLSPIFVGIKLVEFLVIKIIANYTESDASWIDIHTQQLSRRSCVRPRSWYIWHFCVCFVHIQSARIQTK